MKRINSLLLYAGREYAVDQLAFNGRIRALPQRGGACYYTFPTEYELKKFADKGFNLYDTDDPLAMLGNG